jgi:hypothetical protein
MWLICLKDWMKGKDLVGKNVPQNVLWSKKFS